MNNKEIILDVKNLNTSFVSDRKEVKIVKNVSFQLKRGHALAVVGESGCGKSVTMNSIMRFLGRNAVIHADKVQYNALHDGIVKEYHLEQYKKSEWTGDEEFERTGDEHGFSGSYVKLESCI